MDAEVEAKGLELLRQDFSPHQIGKLPKPTKAKNDKGKCDLCKGFHGLPAVHLDYLGHAELTDRLLDSDLEWGWEPFAHTPDGLPLFDENGGLWLKLTILGVTRPGYGDPGLKGGTPDGIKEAVGDGLRNAAMRFGCALKLWMKSEDRDLGYVDAKGKPYSNQGNTKSAPLKKTDSENKAPSSPLKSSKQAKNASSGGGYEFLKQMKAAKKHIGTQPYYTILGTNGYEHANEVKTKVVQNKIYQMMLDEAADQKQKDPHDGGNLENE